jgi:hypothetical protein
MRALLCFLVVAFFVACSSEPTQQDLPLQLPSLPPITKKEPISEPTSTQNTSTSAPANSKVVLSDLMLLVRNNGAPLLLGGEEGAAADVKMEMLFRKIRAAAPSTEPDNWTKDWFDTTEAAINGKPDALGRRPWDKACKKCHDQYRKEYKEKYHTRIVPITLDDAPQ